MGTSSSRASKLLLIVAVLCFILGFMPYGRKYTDTTTGEQITEWRIGFDFSPLWHYHSRESEHGMEFESGFKMPSWSWIPVAVGAICLELRRRRIGASAPQEK